MREGEKVEALDGRGGLVLARLHLEGGKARLSFEADLASAKSPTGSFPPLILEMSVLKAQSMSWVIEKATELGVTTFIPVLAERTVVQTQHKEAAIFQDRWQRIADQSLKQCGRTVRMEVQPPCRLSDLFSKNDASPRLRFWLDENTRDEKACLPNLLQEAEGKNPAAALHLLIGPEGGWSPSEQKFLASQDPQLARNTGLGPLTLRAETAAVVACGHLMLHFAARGRL